jgi:hypothetical protein
MPRSCFRGDDSTPRDAIEISVEKKGRGIYIIYSSANQMGTAIEHAQNCFAVTLKDTGQLSLEHQQHRVTWNLRIGWSISHPAGMAMPTWVHTENHGDSILKHAHGE